MAPPSLVSTLAVPLRFVLGVVAGVAAVLLMDLVMRYLPEGETPPFVAAGVLTDAAPADAPSRLATVVHYLAGLSTGPLFVWVLLTVEGVLGGPSLTATLVATLVLYVSMVGFFAAVVLPRSGVEAARHGPIRRDWALSALAYLAVLVPAVFLASDFLVGP
jgi:hypothetical protein